MGIPEVDIINIAIKSLGLSDISKFNPFDKIIEYKIDDKKYFSNLTFEKLINEFSRPTPTPGGGSAAAMGAALGASLASMVSNLTINKKGYELHNTYHNTKSINCQKNIPLRVLKLCHLIISDASDISDKCNINSISDIGVSAEFLKAAANSASYNVLINIKDLKSNIIEKYTNDVDYYIKQIEDSYITIINNVNKSLLQK